MADEISKSTLLKVTKGNLSITPSAYSTTIDMSGTDAFHGTQNVAVGGSNTALSQGAITTLGQVYIRNIGATNPVDLIVGVGGSDEVCFAVLAAGDSTQFPANPAASYKVYSAAGTQIEIFAIEA